MNINIFIGTITLAELPLFRPTDLATAGVYGYLILLPGILFAFSWLDWVNCKCGLFYWFHSIWGKLSLPVAMVSRTVWCWPFCSRVAPPHQLNRKVCFWTGFLIAVVGYVHFKLERWSITILLKNIVKVHPFTLSFRHGLVFELIIVMTTIFRCTCALMLGANGRWVVCLQGVRIAEVWWLWRVRDCWTVGIRGSWPVWVRWRCPVGV